MPQLEAVDIIKETVDNLGTEIKATIDEMKATEGGERDKLGVEIKRLEDQITGLQGAIKEATERPSFAGIESTKSAEKGKFSWGRAMKLITGVASHKDPEYGYEMEVFQAGMETLDYQPEQFKTAINASTDASGGFLVPTEAMEGIIGELEANEIAVQLGATVINGMVGNVTWTVSDGGVTAEYVDTEAEADGNESVPTFSNINIKPHVSAAFVPLTWSMLNQPAIALDGWVQSDIAKKIALREDLSFFLGTGSAGEPRGIFENSNVATYTWLTDPMTEAGWGQGASPGQVVDFELLGLMETVVSNNGLMAGAKTGYAMGWKLLFNISATKDNNGQPVFRGTNQAFTDTLMGSPAFATTQLDVAANTDMRIVWGDWSQALIARWGTMAFSASDTTETNFRKLRTTIRGVQAHDTVQLQPKAFAICTNVAHEFGAFGVT